MFMSSAFADEISPDPREQVAVLKACRVRLHRVPLDPQDQRAGPLRRADPASSRSSSTARASGSPPSARRSARSRSMRRSSRTSTSSSGPSNCAACSARRTSASSATTRPATIRTSTRRTGPQHRDEVIRRMRAKAELAAKSKRRAVPRERAPHLRRLARPRRGHPRDGEQPGAARRLRRRELHLRQLRPGRGVGEDEGVHGALPHQGLEAAAGTRPGTSTACSPAPATATSRTASRGAVADGLQGLRDDGAAPPRRRPDRRRHRPGPVPLAVEAFRAILRDCGGARKVDTETARADHAHRSPAHQRRGDRPADAGAVAHHRAGRTHFPPLGRAAEFPTGRNEDVGGHLQVGRERWCYIDGACEMPLPAGVPLRVQATKGPEYTPLDADRHARAGADVAAVRHRALDRFARRWLGERATPAATSSRRTRRCWKRRPRTWTS